MDRLFKRYADPFSFIDGMIQTGRFTEFVFSFYKQSFEEEDERTLWEFYLHRFIEKSFEDFKAELKTNKDNQQMSEETMETTIKESMNILKNFRPLQEGGEA